MVSESYGPGAETYSGNQITVEGRKKRPAQRWLDRCEMRIAYISDAIYPYNKGGKEKRLFEISTI